MLKLSTFASLVLFWQCMIEKTTNIVGWWLVRYRVLHPWMLLTNFMDRVYRIWWFIAHVKQNLQLGFEVDAVKLTFDCFLNLIVDLTSAGEAHPVHRHGEDAVYFAQNFWDRFSVWIRRNCHAYLIGIWSRLLWSVLLWDRGLVDWEFEGQSDSVWLPYSLVSHTKLAQG